MERQNNMMMNGVNTMQKPQSGNPLQQLHAMIMQNLRSKIHALPPGWQSTFELSQRANRIMQLVTALRMLHQEAQKCVQIAEGFEERCIQESATKEIYLQKIQSKLAEIQAKRAQQAQQMPPGQMAGMNMGNPNMGMPPNDMAAMNMMQNAGLGGGNMNMNLNMGMNMNNFMAGGANMGNGGMGNQGLQQAQNFPAQLQQQMRASPLPPQQQQQQQQQQQNNTLDPAALQNPQLGAQPPNMAQATPQQQHQPQANGGMNMPGQGNGPTNHEISELAKKMFANTPEDKKAALRLQFLNSFDDEKRAQILAQPGDPLVRFFMFQARDSLVKRRNQIGQLQGGAMQGGNNNGLGAVNMQQTGSQPGMGNFDLGSMLAGQANAIKSQESGEQVVPASNNQNLALGGQMNMQQGMNPQMLGGNPNGQPANHLQVQQAMAFQREQQRQAHQQKLQQQQNQLAQSQAIAQQQAQAQRLLGQPGGLNAPNALNGGPVNSPALDVLTRPIARQGQAAPSTPQQNRAQNVPPTPVNGANQLVAHHQNMLNQNSQQMGQGQAFTQHEQQLNSLPPAVREKLSQLNPQQINELLAKYRQGNNQNNAGMGNQQGVAGLAPNVNANGLSLNNGQAAMPGMLNGSAIPGYNSQPPANQQQGAMNDPAMQARFQQQMRAHQVQLKTQALDMRHFPRQILSSLNLAVPDGVTEWGKLKQHIINNQAVLPQNTLQKVQTAQANYFDAHPEEVRQALTAMQQRMNLFASMPQQGQQVPQGQQPQGQQPQQPQVPASRPPSIPNGPAPPAQMLQGNPAMPQQQPQPPNMAGSVPNGMNAIQMSQLKPPTPQEIARARQTIPGGQNMTDEQIRAMMMQNKVRQAQQYALQQQAQQNLRNQIQRAQAATNGGQQQGNPQQAVMQQTQQQPVAGQRPPQPQPPPQPQQAPAKQQQQPTPSQGQKRGMKTPGDEVMEIPNPNAPPKGPAQQPQPQHQQQHQQQQPQQPPSAMQLNQQQRPQQGQLPQGPIRPPTREELEKMTPEQRVATINRLRQMGQMEALRKAQNAAQQQQQQQHPSQLVPGQTQQQQQPLPQQQQPQQPPQQQQPQQQPAQLQANQGPSAMGGSVQIPITDQDREKTFKLYQEVAAANPKGAPVQLDDNAREQVIAILKKWWNPMKNIDKTFYAALKVLGEGRVREAMKCRHIFLCNIADASGTVQDYLSITPEQIRPMETFLNQYFTALKIMKGNQEVAKQLMHQQQQQKQQQQQQPQPPQPQQQQAQVNVNGAPPAGQPRPQQPSKPPPPAALDRKPSQQGGRKASAASAKPPPAPTENKSFNWGSIQSNFDANQLKLPAQKKRKTEPDSPELKTHAVVPKGSSPLTAQAAEQIANKPQPPAAAAAAAQQQLKVMESPKAKYKCDDPLCDAALQGFETAEQLKEHKANEHKPVENPLDFLLESAANALGLDKDGNEKKDVKAPVQARVPAAVTRPPSRKAGPQTPGARDGATPATPASGSKAVARPAATPAGKKLTDSKMAVAAVDFAGQEKEKTLLEAMAEKVGFEMPAAEAKDAAAPEISVDLADDSFLSELQNGFGNDNGFIDKWWELGDNVDWGFGREIDTSPELTPDDQSQSSRASDISQSERLAINMRWDAFGNGDTGVPEFLLQTLGLDEGPSGAKGGDAAMLDVTGVDEEQGGKKDGQKADDPWNWDSDLVDWDAAWGPTAGLDGDAAQKQWFEAY